MDTYNYSLHIGLLLIAGVILFAITYCILYSIIGSNINNNIYGVVIALLITYSIIFYLNIYNYTQIIYILFITSIIFSILCYFLVSALKKIG